MLWVVKYVLVVYSSGAKLRFCVAEWNAQLGWIEKCHKTFFSPNISAKCIQEVALAVVSKQVTSFPGICFLQNVDFRKESVKRDVKW